MSFKLVLLTSMVTLTDSYSPGDEINVENDQAWKMIDQGMAKLLGDEQPEKPQSVIDFEAEQEKANQPPKPLQPIHAEGKELNEALNKLRESDQALSQQKKECESLKSKLKEAHSELEKYEDFDARLEELEAEKSALVEQVASLQKDLETSKPAAGSKSKKAQKGKGQ